MKCCQVLAVAWILFFLGGCQQEEYKYKSLSEYGQFAPSDAFEENSEYAYYGSENEWNRRMFSENATSKYYKRQGQRQLLEILDGRFDTAIRICKNTLDVQPQDLESYFNLSIAFSRKSEIDSALYYMKLALDNGLPFTRYLAGPKELLQPIYETDYFKNLKKGKDTILIHGPMKGAITTKSAKIWLRTVDESDVKIVVSKNNGNVIGTFSGDTKAEKDYSVEIPVTDLEPSTEYTFQIIIDGRQTAKNYSFKTYPERDEDKIAIGFGGGAGYTDKHERIWDTLATYSLDAFLMLGDNVYVDLPEMPGAFHDYTYYRRQSRPEYRRFLQSTNIYAIWDDHDAAIDDIWMGPYIDKPEWKLPMLRHFERQWVNPFNGLEKAPGCYFNFSVGNVELFMLDCRFYRTNPFKEERTMLGPDQKEWLKEKILESNANVKVIVSSVPWALAAKPGSKDTWAGFEAERREIFKFLTDNSIDRVILLSADRHRTDVWKIERENDYPLYEFQSSRLTNIHTHPVMPGALLAYNEKCSFGLLEFDFIKNIIVFNIISIDNQSKGRITVDLDELQINR
ncbi:alkaline phosphatase [candidate division KSB1 bacterium]|nr:alkaline phosphatase [candidate division KSB1 bacterium]